MTGLRGTTRSEPDQDYDAKAAQWRAKLPTSPPAETEDAAEEQEGDQP